MYAMQGRRDDDLLQHAELADKLIVDPKLIRELRALERQIHREKRKAEQRHRQKKRPIHPLLEDALAGGSAEIEIVAAVVALMNAPQEVIAMRGAMKPVVTEIG